MVTRNTPWPAGTPCWVDLSVDDIDKAVAFYGGLLGWEFQRGGPEMGGYSLALKNGAHVAGIGPKMMPDMPTAWTTYVATDDLDATVAKITAAGGTILSPAMDVMTLGRMAIATDPAGAVFGLWQSGDHTGFGVANEDSTVTWNENMSRDYEANRKFYGDVFGYRYDEVPNDTMKYATLNLRHGTVGGIGELPANLPPEIKAHWMLFFAVPNIESAMAKLPGLGGRITQPLLDTPYGRMAVATDDQGAAFTLVQPPPTA
ncbi:VOC family protein [Kitasatospora sp. NPDC059673]|uniref:VOC family protein n=1 Tax=Kitasatospora sp. NPDC059673 TaxID=3346901 RepID=UPI00368AB248